MIKNISASAYVGSDKLFDTATLLAYKTQLEGLTVTQTKAALSSAGLTKEQQKQVMTYIASANATKTLTSEQVLERLSTEMSSKANAKELLGRTGLITAKELDKGVTITLTEEKRKEILTNELLNAEEKKLILSLFGETAGKSGLTAATWELVKAQLAQIASSPITWILGAVAAVALLVKGYDALIGRQEKLARTKIEDLDEDISKYDEEIRSLEELQSKLESAKGNKSELAQIQNELNDAIGETTGLLNGEGKAYDIANAKLKANIELKKQQREQAQKDKIKEKKNLFDDNVYEDGSSWFNTDANSMRWYAQKYQELIEEYENALDDSDIKKMYGSAEDYAFGWLNKNAGAGIKESTWADYWDEQVQTAYDIFEDTIEDYDGVGGQDFIKNIINNMVRGGSDLSQISDVIFDIINNQDLQDKINEYWASLVDPEIDSEKALNAVKTMIDGIIKQYPQLESFFNDFYGSIVSGAKTVADTVTDTSNKIDDSRTKMISSINDMSEGFEELDKIYADIKDKGSFDFKLLDDDNFKKNFSGLESYSDFIESVTSSPNDIKKCQSAFNALVTEWIDDTGVLDNLTEANGDLTVSMLEQMGVSNAQEIVHQKLKAAQLNAKIATETTTDEVLRQVGAWINDGEAIGYTKTALFDLISTERIFNNSNLNVAGKIAQLEQLAISFGITADAAGTAGLKMSMLNEIKIAKRDGASKEDIKKIEESYLNYAQSQYQKTFEGRFGKLKTFNYSGSTKSNKTKSNKTSSIKKQVAEIFDWIEVRMSRLKRNIKNLSDTVSNTFKSWSTRRKSLKKEISEISKALSAQKSASSKYLKKANSVDLSESYKKKVREGKIDIESIKDEKLKEKIKKYQEYYQAYLNSKDAEKELEKQLSEAYREQFDLIESEYEGKISLIESNITALENAISLAEAKGKQVGGSYYDDIIAAERERIAALGNEYQALQAQLDAMVASGQIVKYSEEWYAMQNEINQVKQSWDEANISLEQYLQNQREADWSIFDSNQEKIGDVASDNSFLLGLLEDEDMYDENGNITDFGNAANGLRLANMDLYTQQLENYTDELARLEEEYDDKSNTYYLERKRELIEAQQEAINAIKDERQALIDLAKEGYDALLDHMQKIIDKRKEAFNEIKDLRDYEKSIKEQTDEIDVIQKQLIAYQGDDSEESRSTIQKLQQSLKEAQDNLEETQYDKYIKDQEQMYDKLMEDTQNWVDELFENESALLQGIIDNTTANSDRIISIVKQIAEQAGYTIQDEQSTELTDVLQREGYARGSKNIPYKQNNWIHAGELLYRTTDGGLLMPLNSGDKVFTSAMAENLWDMAQMNLHPVVPNYDVSPLVNKVIGSNTWSGDVVFNVEMYGVNDPQEFARQIKLVYSNNTGNVRNMIQTDVFSGDMLAHKKYL